MPIYEFYCSDCHTIFTFLSKRINTEKRPGCPKCDRVELEKRVSLFAISKGLEEDSDSLPDIDEAKMEKAMETLAGEAEKINEDDPGQVGQLMRKLYSSTGLDMGSGMEEAIARMEAGEDPDKIEQDMGDILEGEDPFFIKTKKGIRNLRRKILPPSIDETLYEM